MDRATIQNRPFDEVRIGDSARVTRVLTEADVKALGVVCTDLDAAGLEAAQAQAQGGGRVLAHSLWDAALIASLLGNELPGPGTIYLSQQLRFIAPLTATDTITARVTVREKDAERRALVLDCECSNQRGEIVSRGVAEVIAPVAKLTVRRPEAGRLTVQTHDRFQELIDRVKPLAPVSTVVVHPCSDAALAAAVEAAAEGMIAPILVGPAHKISAIAARSGLDISAFPVVDVPHSHAAAQKGVSLVRAGEAAMLMKGSLHTDELLAEVVERETGLRTERRLSHVFVLDVPSYHKLLMVTDAAINLYPTLDEKRDICQNAVDLAQALGIAHPKVAILSAVETVNPKIPSTTDAASLCKMADRGQITGAILDGPLAMDNAISREAAEIKGIRSEVAGDADILVAPDLEAGNILAKQLTFMSNADAAGVVLGARVPIVLTSRADPVRARLASCAVAVLAASASRSPREAALP
jgi:phosphotransacetylase/acyl dehydratase